MRHDAQIQGDSSESDDSGGDEIQLTTSIKPQWLETFECNEYTDQEWPPENPEHLVQAQSLPPPNADSILRLIRDRRAENVISTALSIVNPNLPVNGRMDNMGPLPQQQQNGPQCSFIGVPIPPPALPHQPPAVPHQPPALPHHHPPHFVPPHVINNMMDQSPGYHRPFPYMPPNINANANVNVNVNVNAIPLQTTNYINGSNSFYTNQPPPPMSTNNHFQQMPPFGNIMMQRNRPPVTPRVDPRLARLQAQVPKQSPEITQPNASVNRANGQTNDRNVVHRIMPINRRRISISEYKMKGLAGSCNGQSGVSGMGTTQPTISANANHEVAENLSNDDMNPVHGIEESTSPPSIEPVFSPAESEANSTPTTSTPEPEREPEPEPEPETEQEPETEPQSGKETEIKPQQESECELNQTNDIPTSEKKSNEIAQHENDEIVELSGESQEFNYGSDPWESDVTVDAEDFIKRQLGENDIKQEIETQDETNVPFDEETIGISIEEPINETNSINELIYDSPEQVQTPHEVVVEVQKPETETSKECKVVLDDCKNLLKKFSKKSSTSTAAPVRTEPIATPSTSNQNAVPKQKRKGKKQSELDSIRGDIGENFPEVLNLTNERRACTSKVRHETESEPTQESESVPDTEWQPSDESVFEPEYDPKPKPKSKKKTLLRKRRKSRQTETKAIPKVSTKKKLRSELDDLNEDIAENCPDVLNILPRRACTLNAKKIIQSSESEDESNSEVRPARITRKRTSRRFAIDDEIQNATENVETGALPPSPPLSAHDSPSPVLTPSPSSSNLPSPAPAPTTGATPTPSVPVQDNKKPANKYFNIVISDDDDDIPALKNMPVADSTETVNNDPIEISSDSD